MKTIKNLSCVLVAAISLFMVSCDKNPNDNNSITMYLNSTEMPYNEDGLWSGAMTPDAKINSQGMIFSHNADLDYNFWTGFIASRNSDTKEYYTTVEWLSHQCTVMTGGGLSGVGTPYLVAYWNSSEGVDLTKETPSCMMTYGEDKQEFIPQSLYVNNTTYTYYAIKNGTSFSRKFADGDYFKLQVYGVKTDGTVTDPVEVYLADYRNGANIIDSWTYVNLENIGAVKSVFFRMESSDSGVWGINTPTYFAMDRMTILLQ